MLFDPHIYSSSFFPLPSLFQYDCSSADINPIGSISKLDLRRFLLWAADRMHIPVLAEIASAKASPELVPVDPETGKAQVSEEDMGLTFEELGYVCSDSWSS